MLCVIDSLGSGGAQRQMINLVCGLKAKGHDVEILVYHPKYLFFRPELDKAGIPVHEVNKGPGFSLTVVFQIRKLLLSNNYSGVISFLGKPNIYSELAKLISLSKARLIVSERSSYLREPNNIGSQLKRLLHMVADSVVANSDTQAKWLRKRYGLSKKVHTIYNGYPLSDMRHAAKPQKNKTRYKYLVVGRISAVKNGLRLIQSLIIYANRNGRPPIIGWAGRQETDPTSLQYRAEMDKLLAMHPEVSANWHWLGERDDIRELLNQSEALLHISLYEGLPNVVCEAFIEGRPVIASNVCDHPSLVEDGVRGVLCDPLSPESICAALERFEALTQAGKHAMGKNARKYAEENLSIEKMVSKYEKLIHTKETYNQ